MQTTTDPTIGQQRLVPRSDAITFYESRFYMLSNFSAFTVRFGDWTWPTSEHAYQAAKFLDAVDRIDILQEQSPHAAKKRAQAMKDKVRDDWEAVKLGVMYRICQAKMQQHSYIEHMLFETGDKELIEASPKDAFWGWGPNKDGQNHLGKIWMRLRNELRPAAAAQPSDED